MPVSLAVENEKRTFTNTASAEADFVAKCKNVTLLSTADSHVAFDRAANGDDFLLKANVPYDIREIEFTKVSVIGNSGSGTLYIMARR